MFLGWYCLFNSILAFYKGIIMSSEPSLTREQILAVVSPIVERMRDNRLTKEKLLKMSGPKVLALYRGSHEGGEDHGIIEERLAALICSIDLDNPPHWFLETLQLRRLSGYARTCAMQVAEAVHDALTT